jgi:mono/diheme cytochrome c family protein
MLTILAHPAGALAPAGILSGTISDATPNAEQLRRGQYLVAAGDCLSCHTRAGGEALAGGLALSTPFGLIYTANLTPDKQTGIGSWTEQQFYRAMHEGVDDQGINLYPAFPYPWFQLTSRADDDAIFAFLKSTPPVAYTPPADALPFPMNFRIVVKVWNLLFLDTAAFRADSSQSAEWNRGAYLVNGLGHCGDCHTPKNFLGGDKSHQAFHGARLGDWVAPDLTSNERTGLGSWSVNEVAEYLQNGRNVHAGAGGPMAEVITYSTSLLTDADRHAIAVYLKSQVAAPSTASGAPDIGTMRRGAAIYVDACSSCHLDDGVGQPRVFPPLGRNAMVQQGDATAVEHVILAGSRIGTSALRTTPLTMPSFAWKLSDADIAAVSTYIRNSWGNQAAAVTAAEVHDLRKALHLDADRLTANSGDRL